MSNTPYRGNGLADTPEEEVLLIHIALGMVGVALASAAALWLTGSAWLVEHQVLVPAKAAPVVQIPGAAGAGLDLSRIAIAAAIVLAVLVIAVSSARRALRHRREDLT